MRAYLVLAAILWAESSLGQRGDPINKEVLVEIFGTPKSIEPDAQKGCGWQGLGVGFRNKPDQDLEVEHAQSGEFRWTIAVFNKYNNTYTCAGSLIHPSVVLTVGHWFKAPGSWRVRAGEWKLSDTSENFDHQDRDVSEVVTHPKMHHIRYNIALLFLAKPITPGHHIGFICLPPPGTVTPPGTLCTATGWGHEKETGGHVQDIMKFVDVPIVSRRECTSRLRSEIGFPFDLHYSVLCAGGQGVDTCRRDGGGPLVCPYSDVEGLERFYQVGMVSSGVGCRGDLPSLYTDVAALRGWIDDTVISRGFSTDTYTMQSGN